MAERPASTFDDQAQRYDGRAGLPSNAGELVARSILRQASAEPGDLVIELGAGTGEIGLHLARLPIQYVGLDSSTPMLDLFREKAVEEKPSLILADCNLPWPLGNDVATVVFASRAIHLLDPVHVTSETMRVGRRNGFLVIGRLLRDRDSVRERMRRRRQDLMRDAGLTPRNGAAGSRRVIALCQDAGAESLGQHVVAEWTGETSPAEVIAGWASLSRMGSVTVDPGMRAGILDKVGDWAKSEFGDLDRAEEFRERYAIDVVRLP
jgi:ubiquinone/menaquinone biosynthesis C-methylase UbiE